jgi:gluconate kinase
MNPALLDSQIATLERPSNALVVNVGDPIEAQLNSIRAAFAI